MKKISISILTVSTLFFSSCQTKSAKTDKPITEAKDSIVNLKITTASTATMNEEGLNEDFYPNGKSKMKGIIKDGRREGLWQAWYENGNLWSEGVYKNGISNGRSVTYFENGKIRYEGKYSQGRKVGEWKYYDEEGKLIKTVTEK